jgi:hypothetical protein
VGGTAPAWSIAAQVTLDDTAFRVGLLVMEPPPPVRTLIPSLMGRAILQHAAVLVDHPNNFVALYQ